MAFVLMMFARPLRATTPSETVKNRISIAVAIAMAARQMLSATDSQIVRAVFVLMAVARRLHATTEFRMGAKRIETAVVHAHLVQMVSSVRCQRIAKAVCVMMGHARCRAVMTRSPMDPRRTETVVDPFAKPVHEVCGAWLQGTAIAVFAPTVSAPCPSVMTAS